MRGIGSIILQMFSWIGLARRLLFVGLALTLTGFIVRAYSPTSVMFPLLALVGVAIALIAPVMMGGMQFRAISAPRTLLLIPHGRLRLLTAAFSTQVLIALPITLVVSRVRLLRPEYSLNNWTHGASFVFVVVLGVLTAMFFWGLLVTRSRYWGISIPAFIIGQRLVAAEFPDVGVPDFGSSASRLGLFLAAVLAVWALYGTWYVRARHIAPSAMSGPPIGPFRWLSRGIATRSDREDAIRIVLVGTQSYARMALSAVLYCVLFIALIAPISHSFDRNFIRGALAPFSAVVSLIPATAGTLAFGITGRARWLWLKTGLDRALLYGTAEAHAWCVLMAMGGTTLAISGIAQASFTQSGLQSVLLLLAQATSGASVMYLGLLRTKEWTATDILIAIGIILLWAAELLMALMGSPWTTLVPLLALQVASLPILRALAKRRWERIDWLICKPIRAATQSLRAAQ